MKIAIISDIHANLYALEEVLNDINLAHTNPDKIILLGDVGSEGPRPKETVDRLLALELPTVQGNTDDLDRANQQPEEQEQDENERRVREITEWDFQQL